MDNNNIDRFNKLSIAVVSVLVTIGNLSIGFYYGLFGINIYRYLELSEIILVFLSNQFYIVTFFALYVLIVFLFGSYSKNLKASDKAVKALEKKSTRRLTSKIIEFSRLKWLMLNERIDRLLKKRWFQITVSFIFILIAGWLFYNAQKDIVHFSQINQPEVLAPLIIGTLITIPFVFLTIELPPKVALLMLLGVWSITSFTSDNYIKFLQISHHYKVQEVELTFKNRNETIRTNCNFVFVGSTRGYYFFWDRTNKKSTAIPTSEIVRETTGR